MIVSKKVTKLKQMLSGQTSLGPINSSSTKILETTLSENTVLKIALFGKIYFVEKHFWKIQFAKYGFGNTFSETQFLEIYFWKMLQPTHKFRKGVSCEECELFLSSCFFRCRVWTQVVNIRQQLHIISQVKTSSH